jgi:hypothetical protein
VTAEPQPVALGEQAAINLASGALLDTNRVCYWKVKGVWFIYLPGCGTGSLKNHTIEEHEDGAITATPSILMKGHKGGKPTGCHGYLTHGVWKDCVQ